MTGFGRTGAWFASEHFDLMPDIMTLAKGAASGYWPLGICAFSSNVSETLRGSTFAHGFTYSHHLVGAAAGMAVIRRIDQLGLVERAERLGRILLDALTEILRGHPHVGDVRGLGMLLAVEIVEDRETKKPFAAEARMASKLTDLARDEGLLIYPSTGSAGDGLGDLVMIGPPLVTGTAEIEVLVEMAGNALERLR
jgi:adenosylmethionine-8-amino-7-oxononanoate aminotransferase